MQEIMPESQGKILGVRISGRFNSDEYQSLLVPRLKNIIQEHGGVRFLLCLEDSFHGFGLSELLNDAFVQKYADNFEKIAVLSGSRWRRLELRVSAILLSGRVNIFSTDELSEAWEWLRT
jgi:hypothetical protein